MDVPHGGAVEIGAAIKELRQARGLTLEALAQGSGVSRAMLSEVERGVKNPTVRVAAQIAAALGTTIAALLGEVPPPDPRMPVVTRRAEQQHFLDTQTGVVRRDLAPALAARGLAIMRYTLPPGTSTGPLPPLRPGAALHLTVLAGQFACTVGAHELALDEGDTLSFDADLPHAFANAGGRPAECVVVVDTRET